MATTTTTQTKTALNIVFGAMGLGKEGIYPNNIQLS